MTLITVTYIYFAFYLIFCNNIFRLNSSTNSQCPNQQTTSECLYAKTEFCCHKDFVLLISKSKLHAAAKCHYENFPMHCEFDFGHAHAESQIPGCYY